MNSNFYLKDDNIQEEQLILCLKQEVRFQFFSPIEITVKEDDQLVYFKTQKFLFYGYKYQTLLQTKETDHFCRTEPSSYIGFMLFTSGEVYIGEFDCNFKFHGEGMFFFSIGCVARGQFDIGKIHGNSIITLPNDNYIFAKFNKGSLSGEVQKINFPNRQLEKMKYTMGEYKENIGVYDFQDQALNNIIDKMSINLIPDDIKEYKHSSFYFGSFLIDNQKVYIGFIENGVPKGWGIMISYLTLEYSFDDSKCFQPCSWTIRNWSQDGFQIDLQNEVVIFSNKKQNKMVGEIAVYKIRTNTSTSGAIEEQNLQQIMQQRSSEGIDKEVLTRIFKTYLAGLEITQRDFQNDFIVSMIFNMLNFKDILFFYLYGSLKKSVQKYFADNMKIFEVLKMTLNQDTQGSNYLTDTQNDTYKSNQSQNKQNNNILHSMGDTDGNKNNFINKKIINEENNLSNNSQEIQPKNFNINDLQNESNNYDNNNYVNPFERSDQDVKNQMKRNSSRRSKFSNQIRFMYNDNDSSMENNIMKLEYIQSSTENRPNTSFKKNIQDLQMNQRPKTSSYNQTKGLVENVPKRQIQRFNKNKDVESNQNKQILIENLQLKSQKSIQENITQKLKSKLQLIFTKNEILKNIIK